MKWFNKFNKGNLILHKELLKEKRQIVEERTELKVKAEELENTRKASIMEITKLRTELEKEKVEIGNERRMLESEIELLGDFIHEQKRINERVKKAINVTREIINYHQDSDLIEQATANLILNNWKTILALSELSNLRMELFEFCIASNLFQNIGSEDLCPYRCIEKVYKSINSGFDKEARDFNLIGRSFAYYNTKRILPIAFFILLDNARKYTIPNRRIDIVFRQENDVLWIEISNWGPLVESEEYERLTERGFRGKNAKRNYPVRGKGLGLAILKRILNICEIPYEFKRYNGNIEEYAGIAYGIFTVKLKFSPLIFKNS